MIWPWLLTKRFVENEAIWRLSEFHGNRVWRRLGTERRNQIQQIQEIADVVETQGTESALGGVAGGG